MIFFNCELNYLLYFLLFVTKLSIGEAMCYIKTFSQILANVSEIISVVFVF